MFSESKLPNSIVTGVVYWLIRNLTFVAYKIIHSEFVEAGDGGGGGGGGKVGGWGLENVDSPFSDGWGIAPVFFKVWWAGIVNFKVVRYCTYVEFLKDR